MDIFSLVKCSGEFRTTLISTHETRMYRNMKAGIAVKFMFKPRHNECNTTHQYTPKPKIIFIKNVHSK